MSTASLKDFMVNELVDYLEANGVSEGVVQNFEKIELGRCLSSTHGG